MVVRILKTGKRTAYVYLISTEQNGNYEKTIPAFLNHDLYDRTCRLRAATR